MKVEKDGRIIEVTEKAYNVLYKSRGFKKIGPSKQPKKRDYKDTNTVSKPEGQKPVDKSLGPTDMRDLTKDEIMTILDNEGIEYSSRDRKEDLFNLIP